MMDRPIQKCKCTSSQKKNDHNLLFKQKGLQIIIECNLKDLHYLGVTFNLNEGSYRPYRKPVRPPTIYNQGTFTVH